VRKTRIDQLLAEGSRLARPVRRALQNPDQFIAATQLGITMASLGLGWIGEPAIASLLEPALNGLPAPISVATAHTIAVAIAFSIITALHIVLGELAPKTVALQYPEQVSLVVAKPTELFLRVFHPFIRALNGMGWAGRAPVRHESRERPRRRAFRGRAQDAGHREPAGGCARRGRGADASPRVHFAEFTAAEMMVPRTEMTAVKADATISEVVDRVWRGRHTSLPVYRGELDDIVGIMLVPDLVRALASPPANFSVAAIAREALTVPETMKADELLRQMRRHRTHQAIVIDEYGGTAGLVTFERVMERIVGELGGDFGTAHPRRSPASGWICLGRRTCARDRHQRTVRSGYRRGNLHDARRVHAGQLGRRQQVGDVIEVGAARFGWKLWTV
jgi:CBS domain containing-hemolysin-like protein